MSKKDGRMLRFKRNEAKKRQREEEGYRLFASMDRVKIDLKRLFGN